jgi:hypothetical protein
LVARGYVFVTGLTGPGGSLYYLIPSQLPGAVATVTSSLGTNNGGIAFDGDRVWIASAAGAPGAGTVSIVSLPTLALTTVSTGLSRPRGIIYDGLKMWVTDVGDGTLKKLDSSGAVIQTISVGSFPQFPAFDGTNIWVPNAASNTVTVVRAGGPLAGAVLATLTGNGLDSPRSAAFDGERILITNGAATSLSVEGFGSHSNRFLFSRFTV